VIRRRCAAVLVMALVGPAASGCTVVTHSSTLPTSEPVPVDSPAPTVDAQLRQVLDVANAQAGQCGDTPPATPDPKTPASLCSADRVLLFSLGPAAVSGPEVSDVQAVFSSARPVVRITVTPQGAAGLVRVTSDAATASPPRNEVALVSHGRVQAALPVTDAIDGQVLEITGFDSLQAAQQAAALLLSSGQSATSSPTPS
jgi:preprotein translocase subunit SecD